MGDDKDVTLHLAPWAVLSIQALSCGLGILVWLGLVSPQWAYSKIEEWANWVLDHGGLRFGK